MSRLEGSRWRLRWAREMPLAMEFEWGFFRPLFGGQTCMWALPRVWRREADTTSCVADYLTRSVRRASGFVLARHSVIIREMSTIDCEVLLDDRAKDQPATCFQNSSAGTTR